MRLAVIAFGLCLLLMPALASAESSLECRRMTQSIAHYQRMHERAKQLGNPMWTERTKQQVRLLEDKRAMTCPEYSANAEAARAFRTLSKIAAKAAVKYFTFGAF